MPREHDPARNMGNRQATGVNVEALGVERGHRTLVVTRKGSMVTIARAAHRAGDRFGRRRARRGTSVLVR